MRLSKLVILVLLLASCQVFGGGEESSTGNNAAAASGSIQWERDPLEVVFRADIVGGEDQDSFFRKNNVPDCTVYGDNRVVWDNEALRGEAQILWDRVSDAVIRNFIGELTVNYRIFTYDAQADLEPPSSVAPVVEVITLRVNDMVHTGPTRSEAGPATITTTSSPCVSPWPRPPPSSSRIRRGFRPGRSPTTRRCPACSGMARPPGWTCRRWRNPASPGGRQGATCGSCGI